MWRCKTNTIKSLYQALDISMLILPFCFLWFWNHSHYQITKRSGWLCSVLCSAAGFHLRGEALYTWGYFRPQNSFTAIQSINTLLSLYCHFIYQPRYSPVSVWTTAVRSLSAAINRWCSYYILAVNYKLYRRDYNSGIEELLDEYFSYIFHFLTVDK